MLKKFPESTSLEVRGTEQYMKLTSTATKAIAAEVVAVAEAVAAAPVVLAGEEMVVGGTTETVLIITAATG